MPFAKNSNAVRAVLYSSILVLLISEAVFTGITMVFEHDGMFVEPFSASAFGISVLQIIWVSVLLGFNSKPTSQHCLCSIKSHLISIAIFTVSWLVIALSLSISSPVKCAPDQDSGLWCPFAILGSVFGWILLLVCMATTAQLSVKARHWGFSTNVARSSLTSNPLSDDDDDLDV